MSNRRTWAAEQGNEVHHRKQDTESSQPPTNLASVGFNQLDSVLAPSTFDFSLPLDFSFEDLVGNTASMVDPGSGLRPLDGSNVMKMDTDMIFDSVFSRASESTDDPGHSPSVSSVPRSPDPVVRVYQSSKDMYVNSHKDAHAFSEP